MPSPTALFNYIVHYISYTVWANRCSLCSVLYLFSNYIMHSISHTIFSLSELLNKPQGPSKKGKTINKKNKQVLSTDAASPVRLGCAFNAGAPRNLTKLLCFTELHPGKVRWDNLNDLLLCVHNISKSKKAECIEIQAQLSTTLHAER